MFFHIQNLRKTPLALRTRERATNTLALRIHTCFQNILNHHRRTVFCISLVIYFLTSFTLINPCFAASNETVQLFNRAPGDINVLLDHRYQPQSSLFNGAWVKKQKQISNSIKQPITNAIGIRFMSIYTALGQFANEGRPEKHAAGGDFDFIANRKLFLNDPDSSLVGLHLETRHKYTPIAPAFLNETFRSVIRTTNGFNTFKLEIRELWWEKKMPGNAAFFRAGKIDFRNIINSYAYDNQKFTFLDNVFTGRPAITEPGYSLGMVGAIKILGDVYTAVSVVDARPIGPFVARDRVYFKAIELGYIHGFRARDETNYHLMLWETDPSPSQFRKESKGASLVLQDNLTTNMLPFFRMDLNNGEGSPLKQLTTTGIGISELFGKDYTLLGLGAGYGKPREKRAGREYVLESFYRVQCAPFLQITPDIQFIQKKPYRERRRWVNVYSLRIQLLD